jgi:hypothetical protein
MAFNELAHQYAAGIRAKGFKKWHERELIESHADLITALLLLAVSISCLEWYASTAHVLAKLASIAIMIFTAGLSMRAFIRYGERLFTAEALASQAVCPSCKAYASFNLEGEDGARLKVRCKRCAQEWTLESSD